jgi:hypothetical protein
MSSSSDIMRNDVMDGASFVRRFIPQAGEVEIKAEGTLDFASRPIYLYTECPHENMLHRSRRVVIITLRTRILKMCLDLTCVTYCPHSESGMTRASPSQF